MSVYLVLKWAHVIAMAYWLGGEWGVFNASRYVARADLPMDERRRHMETAYRIDILPRTGIILLLPLGLHLGHHLGVQPLGGAWLAGMWLAVGGWFALTWTAFAKRGTDLGVKLTRADELIRYVVIPLLLAAAIASLVIREPFGARWYAAKILIYALLLVIGLFLRYIMRDWVRLFRQLASEGGAGDDKRAIDAELERKLAAGRALAYVYWIGIGAVAYLGVAKPFW